LSRIQSAAFKKVGIIPFSFFQFYLCDFVMDAANKIIPPIGLSIAGGRNEHNKKEKANEVKAHFCRQELNV
jgi:hypothetical protein